MQSQKIQPFANREEAGRDLAKRLAKFGNYPNVIVLALPNGGVPVGAEVAALLNKPFDVLLVGKISAPGLDDKTLGAITSGGVRMLNSAMIDHLHLSDSDIKSAVLRGSMELARKERIYRGHHPSLQVADHTVILVDDGTTPCESVRDAIRLLRRQHADQIIVALPAACRHSACDLRLEADAVVTLAEPSSRTQAGKWFRHFPKTTDEDVRRLLAGKCPLNGTKN